MAKGLRAPRKFDFGSQKDFITELRQDWRNRLLEGTKKPCAHQDPGERRVNDPIRNLPTLTLACECQGVYEGGVGWQWPAAGSGTVSVAMHTGNILREVTIIFITSTIIWSQFKQQGGNTVLPINRKLD